MSVSEDETEMNSEDGEEDVGTEDEMATNSAGPTTEETSNPTVGDSLCPVPVDSESLPSTDPTRSEKVGLHAPKLGNPQGPHQGIT